MSVSFDLGWVESEIAGTRFRGRLIHLPVAGSTNQLALEAAATGVRDGVWIADEQTAGRGRGGHAWHSAAGDGLYVSALVTPHLPIALANRLPLLAGLAAQTAIFASTGLYCDLRWPNDLMFDQRKVGGILVESAADARAGAALRFAVIGIGINLNHQSFPEALAPVATSLWLEAGSAATVEREHVLAMLLRALDDELTRLTVSFERSGDTEELQLRFSAASGWVEGKHVRVGADEAGNGGYAGWTRGLDKDGFLLVEDEDGVLRTVLSGGVRSF